MGARLLQTMGARLLNGVQTIEIWRADYTGIRHADS